MFKIDNIAKRESTNGFNGLRYAPNIEQMTKQESVAVPNPTFGKGVFKTMDKDTAKQFTDESVEFGKFIDHKRHLAGERNVEGYEDEAVLKFDPVKEYTANESGYSTYDSGKFQGGMSGESRLKGGEHRPSFAVSMEQQNPFHTQISNKIKIR